MLDILDKTFLWIHIPCGFMSLILFWLPVGVKKGSPIHRKAGRVYYKLMWIVLITSILLSLVNTLQGEYNIAAFLAFLSIITAYPLWYSYEILHQKAEWTESYYNVRRLFCIVLLLGSIGMILLGGIKFQFKGMGTVMLFFGFLGLPAIRDIRLTKQEASARETRMKMHIQGTIISGIAAYTAFFAFGGRRFLADILIPELMFLPWVLPTILGVIYSRYMKRRHRKII